MEKGKTLYIQGIHIYATKWPERSEAIASVIMNIDMVIDVMKSTMRDI
jgi:hypothetical protein